MCHHRYCQLQTVDFSNKHKKTSHYKQYKLIAHPANKIPFLVLESTLGDHVAIQNISEVRWNAYDTNVGFVGCDKGKEFPLKIMVIVTEYSNMPTLIYLV
jgi:hypothetical protein